MRVFVPVLCAFVLLSAPAVAAPVWDLNCNDESNFHIEFGIERAERTYFKDRSLDERYPRLIVAYFAGCTDRVLSALGEWDWGENTRFRDWFTDEVHSTIGLLANDVATVYELALHYRQKNGDDVNEMLDLFLTHWAIEHDYGPAVYDQIQQIFADHPESYNIGHLRHLASKGYVPAMVDAARRWILADGAKRNLGSGFYWLKRAEAEGIDMAEIIPIAEKDLLNQMDEEDRKQLLWAVNGFGELDDPDPNLSFQVLRQRTFTQERCEDILEISSERIPYLEEAFAPSVVNPDARIPMAYALHMAPCIDVLIKRVPSWDWDVSGPNHKTFMDELKRTRELFRGDMKTVFDMAEFHRKRDLDDLDKSLAFFSTIGPRPTDILMQNFVRCRRISRKIPFFARATACKGLRTGIYNRQ